jgi:hypothetical protein
VLRHGGDHRARGELSDRAFEKMAFRQFGAVVAPNYRFFLPSLLHRSEETGIWRAFASCMTCPYNQLKD